MERRILELLAICFCLPVYGQQLTKSDGYTRTQHGYFFYKDRNGEYVTFVPVKDENIKNKLSNFDTKNLGTGYQLITHHINTDSLSKFGRSYKVKIGRNDTSIITIVPVTLTYHVNGYGRTEEEILARAHEEWYIISNKRITVQVTGGVSFRIMESTPKVCFFETWE